MQSIEAIKRQISKVKNYYIFFTEKEIRYLPEIMAADERILALTSGYANRDTWLLVCTDRQVIFCNRGMIYGTEQFMMPLQRIQSIDSQTGILFGSIRVWDGAKSIEVGTIWKSSIAPFVRTVQEAMSAVNSGRPIGDSSTTSSDVASQLERLAKLKGQGVITHEEFEKQKQKLME